VDTETVVDIGYSQQLQTTRRNFTIKKQIAKTVGTKKALSIVRLYAVSPRVSTLLLSLESVDRLAAK
jgi:hypothetical protein